MKFRYFFMAMIASLLFVACASDDDALGTLGNFQISETYVTIPDNGGSVTVSIKSTGDWSFQEDLVKVDGQCNIKSKDKDGNDKFTPCWYNISEISGTAGETNITITAPASESGREVTLYINAGGNVQFVNIRQGDMTPETATCAEINAGPDGKSYRLKGTVTSIANFEYGNMYIADETGQVYVYGTLDKDGKTKNFASLGIEVGDVVEVEGPKSTYNGAAQLVNITVNKITKSLIKVVTENAIGGRDGGDIEVKVAFKGKGTLFEIPSEFADWVKYKNSEFIAGVPTKLEKNPADTVSYKFNVLPNSGAELRSGSIKFTSSSGKSTSEATYTFQQAGNPLKGSISAFNMDDDGAEYTLTGVVREIKSSKYGNMYIVDGTGEAYIYGTLTADGEAQKFESLGIKEGDVVTLKGTKASYNGNPQMKNATYVSHITVPGGVTAISVKDFLAAPVDAEKYYLLTGTVKDIKNTKYGNFDIADLTGSVYVYGLLTGWDGESGKFTSLGINEGYTISMLGVRAAYNGTPQVGKGAYVSTLYVE